MQTFIILFPVTGDFVDPRNACNRIEGTEFEEIKNLHPEEVIMAGVTEMLYDEVAVDKVKIMSMHEFMSEVNNERFNPDNYFISYVYVKNENV